MQTLFLIVFLDLVGFGMIIPVLPFFATRLGIPESMVVFLFGLYSLGQLVGSPLWGALSDRVGRRPVLLFTLAANVLANLGLAVAANGWQLGAARLIAGLAAGNISTAYAYVTDVTDDKTRPRALGLLGAAFGLGFIIGPALGGVLAGVGETSGALARCAHVAAIMSAAAFVATLVLLRESHGPEHRAHAATHVRSNRWQIMNRPVLRELLTATFLFVAGIAMFQSTFTVWSATALGVTPRVLGIILGATGVLSVAVQGGAIGPLTRRFGAPRLTRAGAALCTVSLALLVFAHTLSGTYVSLAIMTLGGAVFVPSISTLVAATASSVERGAVLGVFQSASSFGRVAGPFLATVVIRATSVKWPFAVAAAISLGALGVLRLERAADAAGTVAAAQEIVPLSAEDAKS